MKWIAVVLAATASLSATDLTPAQWRADIAYLAKELPARHKNLFFRLSKDEFERRVGEIERTTNLATELDLRADLAKLVAAVGDVHTNIQSLDYLRGIGIGFYEFPDGIYCTSARVELADAVGARLVKIDGVPAKEILERLRPFVPHETDAAVLALTAPLLGRPAYLEAVGVPMKDYTGELEMERGGRTFLVPFRIPPRGPLDMRRAPPDGSFQTPLYQSDRDSKYWLQFLPETRTLYIQYNACAEDPAKPFSRFAEEVARAIRERHPARVAVDLRHNGGGDSRVIEPLLKVLKELHGRLYGIVGRETLSAGLMAASDLKHNARAKLVGEPSGQKPNSYGDVQSFELPNSRLVVNYSTKYFKLAERGDPPTYPLDHVITLTPEELQAGRDPMMEWIQSH